MSKLTAFALRKQDKIEVTIFGFLQDSCQRVAEEDVYPGGNIAYVIDPGEAQVFLKQWRVTDSAVCGMIVVPFVLTQEIKDANHEKVGIFINGKKDLTVEVATKDEYDVYQLTGGIVPSDGTCSIVPASVKLPPVYTKVFGPENYKVCSSWVLNHCKEVSKDALLLGGGSEAPRG